MNWPSIEGETPIDPSGLKLKGITTRAELNIAEADNIRRALVKYLAVKLNRRTAPFDFAWCLQLHVEMFGGVWNWAGQLRQRNLNLGIPFAAVSENLAGLLADLESWPGFGMEMIEQATRLHHRAVYIHPFENGNGRWSRLLANIWLQLHDHPLILWPEPALAVESELRQHYIAAIKVADGGDYVPLLALHRAHVAP